MRSTSTFFPGAARGGIQPIRLVLVVGTKEGIGCKQAQTIELGLRVASERMVLGQMFRSKTSRHQTFKVLRYATLCCVRSQLCSTK